VILTLMCQISHCVKKETFVYRSKGVDFDSDFDFDPHSQQLKR
jgi:hypothetical protein